MGKKLKILTLYVLTGIAAGISSTIFVVLLKMATEFRIGHSFIIWFLPLIGLFIGAVYSFYGKSAVHGNNLVLDEVHNPKNILPLRMFPLVLGGTLLTHLFGGSAGREGTVVQMSSSLADQIGKFFNLTVEERRGLLVAGMGAGFGSAMGAPWAGIIFGMEVIQIGRLRLSAWPQCVLTSFIAYGTSVLLNIPHSSYRPLEMPGIDWSIIHWIFLAGIIFGLSARFFSKCAHFVERTFKSVVGKDFLRPFLGGILLIFFYLFVDKQRYAGLGISIIQDALVQPASVLDPALKSFFTALTVGSGFKGGEFVPLVYIGTTMGSFLGTIFPVSFSLLAALGFGAVFAGAANTPLACALLTAEVFGWSILPYAIIACYMSYYCSGYSGLYRSQIISRKKHHRLNFLMSAFSELKKIFFKKV